MPPGQPAIKDRQPHSANHARRGARPAGNSSTLGLFAAFALVLSGVLAIVLQGAGDAGFAPEVPAATPAAAAPGTAPVPQSGSASDRNSVAAAPVRSGDEPTGAAVRGRVVFADGQGAPGIAVGRDQPAPGEAALATSGSDGAFTLRDVPAGVRLVAQDPHHETLVPAVLRADVPLVLVIAPRIAVAGTVIDVEGKPVAGAMLSIVVPAEGGEGAGVCGRQWLAFSGDDGAFAFAAAPGLATARLATQHPSHRTDERALPIASPLGIVVTLAAEPPPQPVRGTVFGPDGAPFANASVCMGQAFTASAADGTFALVPPPWLPAGAELFVMASGCTPVAVPDPRPKDGRAPLPQTVQLQHAVAITGRVVDAAGVPMPQWIVVLGDPTPVVLGHGSTRSVEGHLGTTRAVTDAAGQFAIRGVFPRSYALEAWDERGQRGLRASVAPADGPVTLVASERAPATLRGVVVADDGRPVTGALVGEERPGCLASGALAMRFDQRATTGPDGRFELPLRGAALHLVVDAATIVPCRIPLPAGTSSTGASEATIRVQVARRRDVLVGPASSGVLAFAPVDAEGTPLPMCEPAPGTFGLPATTHSLVVHHRGVPTGVLPMPAHGMPLEVRL